jgi:hypothetical protein
MMQFGVALRSRALTWFIDPGGYWWHPTYSSWLLLLVFSTTSSSVLLCNCGFYTSGVV